MIIQKMAGIREATGLPDGQRKLLDRQAASDGDYYVKELSRSEGYELSIGNRKHPWTNAGQDLEVSAAESEGAGYAVVTKGLYAEQQVQSGASGAYGDPAFQELFFQVNSEKAVVLIWCFPAFRREAACIVWIPL